MSNARQRLGSLLGKIRSFLKKIEGNQDKELSPGKQKAVDFCNRFAVPLHLIVCVFLCFCIEWMSRRSFGQAVTFVNDRTKVFLYNALLIFITTLPVFLLRRRFFYRCLICTVWLTLGIANGIILSNRVTPLTGPDMTTIGEAMSVLTKYVSLPVQILIIAGLVIAVLVLIVLSFRAPRYRGKRNFKLIIPGLLLAAVGFFGLTRYLLEARQLSSYFGNIAFAYQDYGFPYCLSVTILDTGIDEPEDYSARLIEDILREAGDAEATELTEYPDIIVVQLESFFDATNVEWLKFSEDPYPNWHALSKEYTSGLYTVPTVGAGTVNTEFETLTGMSLRYFGAGEYPFKGVLKERTCESAPYVLGKLGYTAHAVHNNYATFYSRKTVYANLGFNDFTSSEYMSEQENVNEIGWMRDETLIPHIGDALDSTENQDFVFVVSVQGHGAYPTEDVIEDPAITVTGAPTAEKNSQWEYYVNSTHEMDTFVKDLIEYVDERGKPAVIMFYGDHLPTMGLADADLKKGTTYQTCYLMWDNLGLKHKKNHNLTSYQAMADLLGRIGIHDGTIYNFHRKMKNKELYQYDLQTLQYDILYGKQYVYGESNPFAPKIMAMGVRMITLDSVEQVSEGTYYLHGKNFTQSSKLMINDDWVETSFVNTETLLVTGVSFSEGDLIRVGQLSNSNSGKILSNTKSIVWHVPETVTKETPSAKPSGAAPSPGAEPSGTAPSPAAEPSGTTPSPAAGQAP